MSGFRFAILIAYLELIAGIGPDKRGGVVMTLPPLFVSCPLNRLDLNTARWVEQFHPLEWQRKWNEQSGSNLEPY